MVEKTSEFWVALVSAALYVYLNSKEKVIAYRLIMVASSAGFGFSLSGDAATFLGIGKSFAGVLIIVFSYLAIDLVTALISDRAFIKDIIKNRLK